MTRRGRFVGVIDTGASLPCGRTVTETAPPDGGALSRCAPAAATLVTFSPSTAVRRSPGWTPAFSGSDRRPPDQFRPDPTPKCAPGETIPEDTLPSRARWTRDNRWPKPGPTPGA